MKPERILRHPHPRAQRGVPMVFGLVFLVLGLLDARSRDGGFKSLEDILGTLGFIPLLIGLGLIALPLLGLQDDWRIGRAGVLVTRRNFLGARDVEVRRADISKAAVREHEWESRPHTFSVEIRLADGRRLSTPEFGSRDAAETALQDIRAAAR